MYRLPCRGCDGAGNDHPHDDVQWVGAATSINNTVVIIIAVAACTVVIAVAFSSRVVAYAGTYAYAGTCAYANRPGTAVTADWSLVFLSH